MTFSGSDMFGYVGGYDPSSAGSSSGTHHHHSDLDSGGVGDDDEWYPPSPPVYDVTDKLIEINRELYDNPFSTTHQV